MMGSIGVTVALIGWALFFAIEQLASAKYRAVRCVQCLRLAHREVTRRAEACSSWPCQAPCCAMRPRCKSAWMPPGLRHAQCAQLLKSPARLQIPTYGAATFPHMHALGAGLSRHSKTSCCRRARWLLSRQSLGVAKLFVAWLVNLAYSLALVFASTWTVVAIAPEVSAPCLCACCSHGTALSRPQAHTS